MLFSISESDEDSSDSDYDIEDVTTAMMQELNNKKNHPDNLHNDLWFNEAGEVINIYHFYKTTVSKVICRNWTHHGLVGCNFRLTYNPLL